MSAVMEIWMGELAKLREKVRAKKKPFLSSSIAENEQVEEEKKAKKETRKTQEETTMSETTICLLMDRFVPW